MAAAGSAVGLGNIWLFPYITGLNGGGLFVLVYLACVILVGLPVMTAEILLGRTTQCSPVGAFKRLAGPRSPWVSVGWVGVASSFLILSYYSVVAGWALHYTWLSLTGALFDRGPDETQRLFDGLLASSGLNLFWHTLFMGLTVAVVMGGVAKGLERWARILMPALFVMMGVLLARALFLNGFGEGASFVLGFHSEQFRPESALAALGQAFFSLSLGMGSILTYGSYLREDDDIMSSSIIISGLDTGIAMLAALVIFPIVFTYNIPPGSGPGLIFVSIPVALGQMPGGGFFSAVLFFLLVFAALTSAVSMLEVATSYFIDERGWERRRATLVSGAVILLIGVPSALSGATALFGGGFAGVFGQNWFDTAAYLANNWMLPLSGLGIAAYTGWRMNDALRHHHFLSGSKLAIFYRAWLLLLRFLVPVAILFVFLNAIGVI